MRQRLLDKQHRCLQGGGHSVSTLLHGQIQGNESKIFSVTLQFTLTLMSRILSIASAELSTMRPADGLTAALDMRISSRPYSCAAVMGCMKTGCAENIMRSSPNHAVLL